MADSRIVISSASVVSHTAFVDWDTVLELRKEKDQVFYRWRVSRPLVFKDLSYTRLNTLNVDECEEVTVQVQRECEGAFSVFMSGKFNAGDWRDNQDDCRITVTVETEDDYTCFLSNWKTPINMYGLSVVEVKPYPTTETYVTTTEIDDCADCGDIVDPVDPANWCAEPEDVNCKQNTSCTPPIDSDALTTWHRIEGVGTCSGSTPVKPTPDDYWTLLTDNCPTDSTWWRCPGENVNSTNSRMDQGRLFIDIMETLFAPCGLTVVSDFFDINADATAPSNDAYTFAALYLQAMTIHQKSDVKRPYNSDPATSKQWDIKPEEMLNDLRILFNVYWKIDGTDIRIEHVSYFQESGGLDCTADAQKLDTQREVDDNVTVERFFYVDEDASDYFLGSPITYDCGTEEKEHRCQLFSTDVTYIQHTNSEGFADDGFVLCSTEIDASVHYLIRDNRPLSFTELHENLHYHYRYWKKGTLNGNSVTFTTYRPTRKQPEFKHILCCGDTLEPEKPVTTGIGAGYIDTATYRISDDSLRLNIKH